MHVRAPVHAHRVAVHMHVHVHRMPMHVSFTCTGRPCDKGWEAHFGAVAWGAHAAVGNAVQGRPSFYVYCLRPCARSPEQESLRVVLWSGLYFAYRVGRSGVSQCGDRFTHMSRVPAG